MALDPEYVSYDITKWETMFILTKLFVSMDSCRAMRPFLRPESDGQISEMTLYPCVSRNTMGQRRSSGQANFCIAEQGRYVLVEAQQCLGSLRGAYSHIFT